MGIFDNIDFKHLPEDFKEDSVREEIIAPILKCLGYSAFDSSNRIIRSPSLEHPCTQFGTKSSRMRLIPDYLVQANGKNAFVVEAKAPSENIITGKNVEQAYSYAIHREVRVRRFVLCNGREISVFDVYKTEPLLYFQLADASENDWGQLYELLSPLIFKNPHLAHYVPDYGIWCLRNGIGPHVVQCFYNCYINEIAKLDEATFTFIAIVQREEELMASFDFDISLFDAFMEQVPEHLKDIVRNAVRRSPFKYATKKEQDSFPLNFTAYLSDAIIKNENEEYLPLQVKEFT